MKNIFIVFFTLIFSGISSEAQKDIPDKVFIVDTVESEVVWFCGRHYGCVSLDTGYIKVENNEIIDGDFTIDLQTVSDDDIQDNKLLRMTLNNVIKSLPFFNVETFPYSKFKLESVERIDSDYYHVSGVLELQSEVRTVDFNSKIIISDNRIIVESDIFEIDRTNWGINYLSEKFDPEGKETMYVPDTISFVIHLFAYKKRKK